MSVIHSRYSEITNYVAEQNVKMRLDAELKTTVLAPRKINTIKRAIHDVLRIELDNAYNAGYVDGANAKPSLINPIPAGQQEEI